MCNNERKISSHCSGVHVYSLIRRGKNQEIHEAFFSSVMHNMATSHLTMIVNDLSVYN